MKNLIAITDSTRDLVFGTVETFNGIEAIAYDEYGLSLSIIRTQKGFIFAEDGRLCTYSNRGPVTVKDLLPEIDELSQEHFTLNGFLFAVNGDVIQVYVGND